MEKNCYAFYICRLHRLNERGALMQVVTSRNGNRIHVLSLGELDYLERGNHIRAFCPVHGSDHQRSLSINVHTGWGQCFGCQALVLLKEIAPEIAYRLLAAPRARCTPPPFPYRQEKRSALCSQAQAKPAQACDALSWQEQEVRALHALSTTIRQEIINWKPTVYLESRMIPVDLAVEEGVGFLPSQVLVRQPHFMQRWSNRIMFPLRSPEGKGFIGRSLEGWKLGMDEREHKALLEQREEMPHRWIKTNPAGLFCVPPVNWDRCVILVEGGFDRLALLAAGMRATQIVALAGTSLPVDWLPEHVKAVILAFDGDAGGQEASLRLGSQLEALGLLVAFGAPPQDGDGKDWSERWRRLGGRCLQPLLDILMCVHEVLEQEDAREQLVAR
jgi:hypothetical protein